MRHLLEANETLLILRPAVTLDIPVARSSESAVVARSEGTASDCSHKHIISIPPLAQEFQVSTVLGVTNSLQNHVVPLLEGNKSDVFHGLDKGNHLSEGLLRAFLLMHGRRVLVVNVVARPQVLTEHPRENEFG